MSEYEKLSQDLLFAIKTGKPAADFKQQYHSIDHSKFVQAIKTDPERNAFWINTYNAWYQILRETSTVTGKAIYTSKEIPFGKMCLSLDQCEHTILRRNRVKWSLGYLKNIFVTQKVKRFMVDALDYRIHFALNCGALSCPPIRFYDSSNLEGQLDLAMASFIESETTIEEMNKCVKISKLFLWFRNDFGGGETIKKIHGAVLGRDFSSFSLDYNPYDWSDKLGNYA